MAHNPFFLIYIIIKQLFLKLVLTDVLHFRARAVWVSLK